MPLRGCAADDWDLSLRLLHTVLAQIRQTRGQGILDRVNRMSFADRDELDLLLRGLRLRR